MDREHERRGQRRQEAVGPAVVPPLAVGALPAEGEHGVEAPAPAAGGVAQRRDVGDETDDEEHRADRQVRRDREHVPHQRRLEVRPQVTLVRVRQQEVGEPHAAGVDHREQAGGQHGEDRHRLGRPVDRRPPPRAEQVEHGRDQRAGVADADPEHERGDVHRPHLRGALAGGAHAHPDLIAPGQDPAGEDQPDHAHPAEVEVARRPQRGQDVTVDVGERRLGDGGAAGNRSRRGPRLGAHACGLPARGVDPDASRTTFFR